MKIGRSCQHFAKPNRKTMFFHNPAKFSGNSPKPTKIRTNFSLSLRLDPIIRRQLINFAFLDASIMEVSLEYHSAFASALADVLFTSGRWNIVRENINVAMDDKTAAIFENFGTCFKDPKVGSFLADYGLLGAIMCRIESLDSPTGDDFFAFEEIQKLGLDDLRLPNRTANFIQRIPSARRDGGFYVKLAREHEFVKDVIHKLYNKFFVPKILKKDV